MSFQISIAVGLLFMPIFAALISAEFEGLCCQDIEIKLSEEAKESANKTEGTYSIQKTSSNGKVVYKNNITGMYLSWNAKYQGFWMVGEHISEKPQRLVNSQCKSEKCPPYANKCRDDWKYFDIKSGTFKDAIGITLTCKGLFLLTNKDTTCSGHSGQTPVYNYDDCKLAVTYIRSKYPGVTGKDPTRETEKEYPKGCYVYTEDGSDYGVTFNNHGNGRKNQDSRQVCKTGCIDTPSSNNGHTVTSRNCDDYRKYCSNSQENSNQLVNFGSLYGNLENKCCGCGKEHCQLSSEQWSEWERSSEREPCEYRTRQIKTAPSYNGQPCEKKYDCTPNGSLCRQKKSKKCPDVDQGDSGTLDGSTMAPLNNILGVPMEALVAISICAGVIVIGIIVAVIIVCCRGKSDDYNADQVTGWDDSAYDGVCYEEEGGVKSKDGQNTKRPWKQEDMFDGTYYDPAETDGAKPQSSPATPTNREEPLDNDETTYVEPKKPDYYTTDNKAFNPYSQEPTITNSVEYVDYNM